MNKSLIRHRVIKNLPTDEYGLYLIGVAYGSINLCISSMLDIHGCKCDSMELDIATRWAYNNLKWLKTCSAIRQTSYRTRTFSAHGVGFTVYDVGDYSIFSKVCRHASSK